MHLTKFTGHKTYKLDLKGRVAFPSHWKMEENDVFKLIYAEREGHPLIKCYPEESFENMIQNIRTRSEAEGETPLDIDEFVGIIIGTCFDAELNSQGKFPLSKDQRAQLNTQDQVLMVGRGTFFELWKPEDYHECYTMKEVHKLKLNQRYGTFN